MFLLLTFSQSDAFGFDYQRVEKAKYTVTYLGLPVVRVTMENGPPSVPDSGAYRISIQARTTKFWGLFYSIDNSYRTYLDSTGLPLVYSRNINEKSLKKITQQSYDHKFNRIYYEGNTAIDHPGRLENFFSGLFHIRMMPLSTGLVDSFYINVEKASWIVVFTVEGTKIIRAKGKRINCRIINIKFKRVNSTAKRLPTDALSYNLISEDTELIIYLSRDIYRLPIKMQYKLSPFDITATITEFPEYFTEQDFPR